MSFRQGRRLSSALVTLCVSSALAIAPLGSATAETGDCKKVFGKSGKASSGYARVCLKKFSAESGSATLKVTVQKRKSAPDNVYVKAGFVFGGFNTGTKRLGKNSPATYTKTIETRTADPEGVLIQLCYDRRPIKTDRCYKTKVILGSSGIASMSPRVIAKAR